MSAPLRFEKDGPVYVVWRAGRAIGRVWRRPGGWWTGAHDSGTGFVSSWCSTRREAAEQIERIGETQS